MDSEQDILRSVAYHGTQIQYCLQRKNVKNINLRIRFDGSVCVSANCSLDVQRIDEFVCSKGEYISSSLRKFKDIEKYEPLPKQYVSGESFVILGRGVRLNVLEGTEESVWSDGVYLHLSVKDKEDFVNKQRLVTRYFDEQCKRTFTEIVIDTFPLFRKYGVSMPSVRIRDMKTRWGSCLPHKGIITLNKRLLEMPRNCIEYVVLHEFCHFIIPNHSKKFYDFVGMLMPDWKERKSELEKQGQHAC